MYYKISRTSIDREDEAGSYKYFKWRHQRRAESRAMKIADILERCDIKIARGAECPIHGEEHSAIVVHGFDVKSMEFDDKSSLICPGLLLIWRMIRALSVGSRLDYSEEHYGKLFVPVNG